jgi:hypothetical protein
MSSDAVRGTDESRLLEAMADELRLLGALRMTLARMDEAVGRDDAAGVDDAVYASHRLMQTLGQAQLRRAALVEIGQLRAGVGATGAAIRSAAMRLMECGTTLDLEIRGRFAALERLAPDAGINVGGSASVA